MTTSSKAYRPFFSLGSPLATVLSLTMLLGAPAAIAEGDNDKTFGVGLGLFLTDQQSNTRLNGESGSGTVIDLESDLGLRNSDSVFRVDAYYRFNEKHRLDVSLFDLSRSSTKQIQREIEWDGEIYPIDSEVNSNFDMTIYKAAYTYSFIANDKGYLGASIGLYVSKVSAALSVGDLGRNSSSDVTLPLPVIGVRGEYFFTEKLSLRASGEVFAIEYEDYDGSLYDVYAGLDYQLFEHVAIGIGFNSVQLDVGVSKPSFNGDLDWRYDGGLLFVEFNY